MLPCSLMCWKALDHASCHGIIGNLHDGLLRDRLAGSSLHSINEVSLQELCMFRAAQTVSNGKQPRNIACNATAVQRKGCVRHKAACVSSRPTTSMPNVCNPPGLVCEGIYKGLDEAVCTSYSCSEILLWLSCRTEQAEPLPLAGCTAARNASSRTSQKPRM